ncbi:hypothetical protein ACH41H_06770 [Streptomyces sp. NPDC020800]
MSAVPSPDPSPAARTALRVPQLLEARLPEAGTGNTHRMSSTA